VKYLRTPQEYKRKKDIVNSSFSRTVNSIANIAEGSNPRTFEYLTSSSITDGNEDMSLMEEDGYKVEQEEESAAAVEAAALNEEGDETGEEEGEEEEDEDEIEEKEEEDRLFKVTKTFLNAWKALFKTNMKTLNTKMKAFFCKKICKKCCLV
jgi:TATA-binding protein-associated factor Taf7